MGCVGICGTLAANELMKQADLILAIGPRLGEMTTSGYTLLKVPKPTQKLIHVHTSIDSWAAKTFVQKHVVTKDGVVRCDGRETRAFCIRHPDDPNRIKAIPIPADIKALCS